MASFLDLEPIWVVNSFTPIAVPLPIDARTSKSGVWIAGNPHRIRVILNQFFKGLMTEQIANQPEPLLWQSLCGSV